MGIFTMLDTRKLRLTERQDTVGGLDFELEVHKSASPLFHVFVVLS